MLKYVFCHMKEAGKLAVIGSCHMFSDQYIDKEENSKIMVSLINVEILFVHQHTKMVFCKSCVLLLLGSNCWLYSLHTSFVGRCASVAHDR